MKNILICFDRDGTLNFDKKCHLGKQKNWKSRVVILPDVIKGLKELRKNIPYAKIYIITNQPGVAVKDFPLLTKKRVDEVCKYILNKINKNKVGIDGYRFCGKADLNYAKRHPELKFDKKLVGNYPCVKPNPGMVYDILKELKWKAKDTKIYVIGDRHSDVKTAINAGGFGIFVPFVARPEEIEKFKKEKINKKKYYISKNFMDCINFLIKKEVGKK